MAELEVIRENDTSFVHVAEVATVDRGARQVFVKAFPEKHVRNGLVNEIVGYVIAKRAGLPVADSAFVLILRTEQVFKVHPDRRGSLSNDSGLTLTWATTAIDGAPLRLLRGTREPDLQRRLRKWPELPRILALDDLLGNEDRTDDNLIAVRNGGFAIVDHAEIAGGISRLHGFGNPAGTAKNTLLNELYGKSVPNSVKSAMMLAAERHPQVVEAAIPEIEAWLRLLFPQESQSIHAIVPFVLERARLSPARIRHQQGMLL